MAVAEGAITVQEHAQQLAASEKKAKTETKEKEKHKKDKDGHKNDKSEKNDKNDDGEENINELVYADRTLRLAKDLEALTGLEARVTILGHLQRGGTPSAADRILATSLGTACAELIHEGKFGVLVAAKGDSTRPAPLEEVAGKVKTVPLDHPWILTARRIGTNLGD